MMMKRARSLSLLAVFAIAALYLSGCCCPKEAMQRESDLDMTPVDAMAVGEVRYFDFPPDGHWHNSGILVLNGDTLQLEPQGLASGLEVDAIECKVADQDRAFFLDVNDVIRFEDFGPLTFRVQTIKAEYLPGLVEIKITKTKSRAN